ncbi:uncharacterized protein [Eurosta solidaginis]|uniref:uncharacterized protein n=1 Tax=Eurosta solidaginis TaxID=178769 RepID=UPI0035317348
MEKSKMKHTQQKQFEVLVDFMKAHPDLSKGLLKSANGRNAASNLWKRVTSQLNAVGPPSRDVAGWKKVWADYKVHLKSKMRRNKISVSGTGGGPSGFVPLTHLEEEVSKLLSADKSMSGTISTSRFGAKPKSASIQPRESPVARRESPVVRRGSPVVQRGSPVVQRGSPVARADSSAGSGNSCSDNEHTGSEESEQEELPTCSNTAKTPRRKQSLLEHQVSNQIEYHKRSKNLLNEINSNLINIYSEMKKKRELQECRLKLERERFLYQQTADNKKIKMKLTKLELQKEVLAVEASTNALISSSKRQAQ